MADDITLNSGSGGDTIAADDVAGVKYPIQKTAFGALDSVTLAVAGAGVVGAGVQRVTLASDDPAVTDLAAIEVLLGTIDADTSALAGAVSGTEVQVDVASSALPTGAATAAKQPALGTAGTASSDVISVQGIASMTALVVDGSGVTQPVSGTVTVQDGGGAITVDGTVAVTNAGLTELAAAINVSSQMDVNLAASGATVTVDLGANNDVTVTGTVDLGATDNAVLDAIAASVAAIDTDATTIIGHVDGIETVLGTIDTDTGAIATAVQLIDDAVYTDGSGTPSKGLAVMGTDGTNPQIISTNSTGHVNIADGGNAITVDGTVAVSGTVTVDLGANNDVTVTGTVDLGATDNAVLDDIAAKLATIDADTSTLAAAVSTEVQVDVVGALPAGTNAIGKLAANSGVDIGDVDVLSIAAGANAIGNVGLVPRTSGGMTIFRSIDIDESEEEVKSSAGQLFSITAFNMTAAPLFLKFYNLTAANTTVGTSTPVLTFVVPGNADSDGAGFVWNNEIGFAFSTAISVACTTGVADADTGAPGANECIINLGYA